MKRRYIGQFDAAKVEAVLKAAMPIPPTRVRRKDPSTGKICCCSRSIAIIRRLEWISTSAGLSKNDLSPSALAKKLHAIAAAGGEFAKIMRENLYNNPEPQIQHALWAAAAENGEQDPDDRINRILENIEQLSHWCKNAEALACPIPDQGGDRLMLSGMKKENSKPATEALAGILDIWKNTLGRPIQTSAGANDGIARGPLIRFVQASLDLLELPTMKPNAIRWRIQDMEKSRKQRAQKARVQKT